MITFTSGNLLTADVDAIVNTVNTVGIMGKGIALMFKEQFPENFAAYAKACKAGEVNVGRMFITERKEFFGPKWIINFPTKTHWRVKTKIDWIKDGLEDLVKQVEQKNIRSIAIPPLGCGNGGLSWTDVKPLIVDAFSSLQNVDVIVFEPTAKYQNVAKRTGVENLTPARALVAELVRRYSLLGIECSILEIQKLAWFLERGAKKFGLDSNLNFRFSAERYGPYSHNLQKLLDALDGSYLQCDKRIADANPRDRISFNNTKEDHIKAYLNSGEAKEYLAALEWASNVIDGFESPLGMELIATVDWLLVEQGVSPNIEAVFAGLDNWSGGSDAGQRKKKIFDQRLISIALDQLESANNCPA